MANATRFLDSENPCVEHWLRILENESDLEAVIVLVQLIMDNLKFPCTNKVAGSFCLPGQIDGRFDFGRFVQIHIHETEYEMRVLVSNGELLGDFFEKIVEKSDNVSWMLPLVYSKVFRVLILDDRTQFFIEYALIAWYMGLLNVPLANYNEETVKSLKEVCSHLTETIVAHVKAYSVHKRIFTRFVETIQVLMVRNFSEECVCIFVNVLKYWYPELISKTMEKILQITVNNEYVTNLFTVPAFVTALNKILLQNLPAVTLEAALMLAIRIQQKKPSRKLFSSQVFQDYLTERNHKLRKLCADLFKATFEVPLNPASISLLEKVVSFFATLKSDDETVDYLVGSFSGEFTDWDKIYLVTLAQSDNVSFLIDLWEHLLKGALKYTQKVHPNEAEYHITSFMHKGIEFLDRCDFDEHKFVYGLILSFISTQDKQLQMVDLAHRQNLADKLVAIPFDRQCGDYKHEIAAKNLMKALMIQKMVDVNAGAKQAQHLLNENIFEETVQLLADPNFDINDNPNLRNKFMCLAAMAKTETLQGQVGHVAIMSYKLLSHFKGLKRNLDLWGYIIIACVECCAYIVTKCKRSVHRQIDLNKVFGLLFNVLPKCDGKVNFLTYTVFGALCRMEFLKLYTERPQSLDSFIAFISDAIDTFIAKKEEPDFPFHYLDSMIRNLNCVLLWARQELNVHDLVVKVFQTFHDEDYAYSLLEVLARRLRHEAFVKSVIAVFLTIPRANDYTNFAERTNEIIERVPEPRRKEIRNQFNGAFVKALGYKNMENFPQSKKEKATRMGLVVAEIMIEPYF